MLKECKIESRGILSILLKENRDNTIDYNLMLKINAANYYKTPIFLLNKVVAKKILHKKGGVLQQISNLSI